MATISQKALQKIVLLRAKLDGVQAELEKQEDALTKRLKAGQQVQSGPLTGYLHTWQRRNVSWKDVVVREKGEQYAERVVASTKPTDYTNLVVETVA